ncbi:hypothetical protein [uncultured Paraburkholderia sp.]|uniref:hypothetical protein n=1 Tax=uncultured Paraburkholderia sp. TaxID=1822466 RepID=UPI002594051F|nr:hypothetical protein [uncultured Paraburkholderia sp.]
MRAQNHGRFLIRCIPIAGEAGNKTRKKLGEQRENAKNDLEHGNKAPEKRANDVSIKRHYPLAA